MRRRKMLERLFVTLFIVGFAIGGAPIGTTSAIWGQLMAGAAAVPITPGEVGKVPVYPDGSPVFLGGYGSWPEPATLNHDELYARCLVLSYHGKTIVLVVLDTVGLFWPQVEMIRDEVEGFGIDRDYVIVATTHSHASPDTLGLWTYYPPGVNDAYMDYVRAQTSTCVEAALENMQRARLKFASGEVPGIMRNTRDQAEKYAVTYPELEVMEVERLSGGTIATMINFAGHPEVLGGDNREISRDFVHYLIEDVEGELGGIALFFNGALGGMVTPDIDGVFDGKSTPGLPSNHTYQMCKEIGSRLAAATIEVLEDAQVSSDKRIDVDKEIMTIPLENPMFYGGLLMELFDRPDYDPAAGYLGTLTTEVDVIKIGMSQMITLPGEALPSMGHRLKEAMAGKYNFVIGLGNDELGYIIPEEEWDWTGTWIDADWSGKYEESVSVGPETAIIVESTLMKMLSKVVAEGEGSVVIEDAEYSGSAKLYIAGVISLKVDGFVYNPGVPWWYVVPRPESWTVPWVQWGILLCWRWRGVEFYLGYNENGYIMIEIDEGQVQAWGPEVSFSGFII